MHVCPNAHMRTHTQTHNLNMRNDELKQIKNVNSKIPALWVISLFPASVNILAP